jgi:FkbM family methyltransferase
MTSDIVSVQYRGARFSFRTFGGNDHILKILRRTGRFYEQDVLDRLQDRYKASLRSRAQGGCAVDAGAFIGTHSIFFGAVMGLNPVVSFEANPSTYPILQQNLTANGLAEKSIPINCALGEGAGSVTLELGAADNLGSTKVRHGEGRTTIPMVSLDEELDRRAITNVRLLKVDVEGAELDVLDGAHLTLARCRPLLCIEAHTPQHLLQVLRRIEGLGYVIVDCLGLSPTYVIECNEAGRLTKFAVNRIWLLRACVPQTLKTVRWYLRRICQSLTTGRWDPPKGT